MLRELPDRHHRIGGTHGLAITDFTGSESTHYPLTMEARPGRELVLRVEYDTDVFDAASIETLIERLQRVLVAMTAIGADANRTRCRRSMCSMRLSMPAWMSGVTGRC